MLPVIAIVGRPNVGKSTLFNRLTKSKDALVFDTPGVTRDRQYGQAYFEGRYFIVIDTGGIAENETPMDDFVTKQAEQAIQESDLVLFVVDAHVGLTKADHDIVRLLRKRSKPLLIIPNKSDGVNLDNVMDEFYRLGLKEKPLPISAAFGQGIKQLLEQIVIMLPVAEEPSFANEDRIRIAIIGKPNVGKSTLTNRMLGEERVICFDEPGTTRDSIFIPLERRGQKYTLIDTAGIRRRTHVEEALEKFSIGKSLQAIEEAHVVLFVIDANDGLTDQDLKLLGFIMDTGKALVIAVNKWDGLDMEKRERIQEQLKDRVGFLDFAERHFISALHGTGVGNLFDSINMAYESSTRKLSTPELTRLLEAAIVQHQPPMVNGRRIKLRYAHQGGSSPPIIVMHGNQTSKLPEDYKRYLRGYFQDKLKLMGTPLHLQFKSGINPFHELKKKPLTQSELRARKRKSGISKGEK